MTNSERKKEALRYLGYKNQELDKITDELIDDAMDEISTIANGRYIYKTFNILRDESSLILEATNFHLIGEDIKNHLNKSEKCILIGASLGHDVDKKIRYYEKISMTKALILDACATVYIEELCDTICQEIEIDLKAVGKSLTSRYSPGYGDLPISVQNHFLSILDAKKQIGLTATSSSILIPRKSVTAIAGIISKDEVKKNSSCSNCNKYNTCMYAKEGYGCGR
ncbi:MAG: vitamin B12 dependent-methionine synthase activation domain-containing protein [Tissierellia bacterium]|nr:vitamin B12 dependent-methionine synthase activation domain-containing protein [Tissierellia bacterium]MDD4726549.1 vitamin B12 dependent-methionine synthase activation domain-containing protein [Tissierellia bacterium]